MFLESSCFADIINANEQNNAQNRKISNYKNDIYIPPNVDIDRYTNSRKVKVIFVKKGDLSRSSISLENHNETTTITNENHKHNNSFLAFCQHVLMFISFPILFVHIIIEQRK